ncbi:50S ribosomal protein L25/general stress protein Ctc [Desulfohalobiaceae bacterium Ax17]|uniref:50S ribosomal protein L25/general stress protein Ctc n=1 Tax=Desulfovulcanus ferrireducens TaxID=2831190 RepID=UPI00207BB36F|nr:50S ribosomal protein L25/general stress protein Ctc [Desulfovulcanus ferrireducens]MBT8763958.1 50S ribosomal protein L25/general stress protein Ctc [Desulfovulcanus ferrireducens]
MSEILTLQVETRTAKGKGASRKLRKQGFVPAVYYNAKGENIPLQVRSTPFRKTWEQAGSTHVVELEIADGDKVEKRPALIWAVDKHPFKSILIHVDFYGVDLEKEVTLQVPVQVVGKAKGVEAGGIIEIYRDQLEVTCLPTHIPEHIVIDVTDLDINQNLLVSDLTLPDGVKAVFEENFAVVGIVEPASSDTGGEEGEEEEVEE